jgi:ABC-type polysaccharide/polyol phosphate export permease
MKDALRRLRFVQVAMMISIVLYAVIGEYVGNRSAPDNTVFYALSFVSISLVGAVTVVRRTLVVQSEHTLKQRPDDPLALARWRSGYVLIFAMCEALALLGLVLRIVGYSLNHIWGFYVGAFTLLLLFFPRAPRRNFS